MTLRRRLQVFIFFFATVVIAAATWERYAYLKARAEVSVAIAQNIKLDEVANQLSTALSTSVFISLFLIILAWWYLDLLLVVGQIMAKDFDH